jgi:hypothetical protein
MCHLNFIFVTDCPLSILSNKYVIQVLHLLQINPLSLRL